MLFFLISIIIITIINIFIIAITTIIIISITFLEKNLHKTKKSGHPTGTG